MSEGWSLSHDNAVVVGAAGVVVAVTVVAVTVVAVTVVAVTVAAGIGAAVITPEREIIADAQTNNSQLTLLSIAK